MKSKSQKAQSKVELEAELLRLNDLVRERRAELARIQECPNKDCRCRAVWQEQVDKNLASQIRRIRRRVGDEAKPTSRKAVRVSGQA